MKFPSWPNPKGYRNIDLGLSRVYDLLARLDNPHLKLPPTIHIAGTNGKGSTLSFLKNIFNESGLRVHSYTSPHLVNFNERIVLAGKEISDDFLNEILNECKIAAEKHPKIEVTFFEGITVAAFLAFSKIKADLLLLEVGMGGRLDATNVIENPLCSIITPIALDHQNFLGNSLEKIAFEKAGIIKKGQENYSLIIAKQEPQALKTIEDQALKMTCHTKVFSRDFNVEKNHNNWIYKTNDGEEILLPNPSLKGSHQIENAAVAITATLTQKLFPIEKEHIASALQKTFWPARLQKISSGKFFDILPKNCELFLDGGHNIQGAEVINDFLNSQKNKKIYAIFSMLQDKDCQGFLTKIADKIDHVQAIEISDETSSRKASDIKKIAEELKIDVFLATNLDKAFKNIIEIEKNSEEPCLIIVCGSLYLAGEFLEKNNISGRKPI